MTLSLSPLSLLSLLPLALSIAIPDTLPPQHLPSAVAFAVSSSSGASELALLNPEDPSSSPIVLTSLHSHLTHPRISHTRDKIVFSSDYKRDHPILFVIDSNGKNLRPLTSDDAHPIQVAADWSADDTMLVVEEIDPQTGFTRLSIVDVEGHGRLPLMTNPAGQYNDFFARWCPSGHEILFLSDRDSHHPEFYIYDLEDDSVSRLPLPPIVHFPFANGPAFLPGGDEFIYEEENEPDFVHMIAVSMEDRVPSELLFAVDLIVEEENDLVLSQCVPSPDLKSDLLCCRYRARGSSVTALAFVTREGEVVRTVSLPKLSASEPSWK